jgi:L-alanine-DL-glutamate epimerase-like enolase superfamily enzyme
VVLVSAARTGVVELPINPPAVTAIHHLARIYCPVVELAGAGEVGWGYVSAFTRRQAEAIHQLLREAAQAALGQDTDARSTVSATALGTFDFIGRSGPSLLAVAALDTALWDLHARGAGRSLADLLGVSGRRLPVYATGGWLSLDMAGLLHEAGACADRGYRGYKMKVGLPDWHDDVARVAAVRRALDDELALMVDAHQGWSSTVALEAGRAFENLGLTWLEEPIRADDIAGQAELADLLAVPLAAGETTFGVRALTELVRCQAVDVLMLDLAKCGGPSAFCEAADMAAHAGVEVTAHTFTEVSVDLLAAAPTARFVEHVPGWWDALYDEPRPLRDGHLEAGAVAGAGPPLARRHLAALQPID